MRHHPGMKICIIGAGAIGGWMATKLAVANVAEVCVLARGQTLAALQRHGLRLRSAGQDVKVPVRASADASALGAQDLLIVAVKGPALLSVAPSIAPLLGASTVIMPAMNGVPWWFCKGLPGFEQPLASLDPSGTLERTMPFARVLGCVVHASASVVEPGLIEHTMGQRLIVGEPQGGTSDRAKHVVEVLVQAGFEAMLSQQVRQDIWYKLWGNLTMNPVSAITGATIDRLLGDPLVRAFCTQAMLEAAQIGERVGCPVAQTPEDRHLVTAKLGAFKTSMLQDVQAGRALEIDAIVGATHEIGRRLGLATPSIDALFGLTRLFAQQRGLYPDPSSQGSDS